MGVMTPETSGKLGMFVIPITLLFKQVFSTTIGFLLAFIAFRITNQVSQDSAVN